MPKPEEAVEQLVDTGKEGGDQIAVKARDNLLRMGIAAFPVPGPRRGATRLASRALQRRTAAGPPVLIAGLSIKNVAVRTTVGDVCLRDPQRRSVPAGSGKDYPVFLTRDRLDKWWTESKAKTLRQMQIGATGWIIREIERNDQYQSLRDGELAKLKKTLAQLKAEEEAAKAKPVLPGPSLDKIMFGGVRPG